MPDRKPREIAKDDEQWRKELDPNSYEVLRKAATERAFTGEFWDHHQTGRYRCKGCGTELFASDAKYDSGCGWPSFHTAADETNIDTETDTSHGMVRTEVLCNACGGHLGHLFPDGPAPTGMRYCINSASLTFEPESEGS